MGDSERPSPTKESTTPPGTSAGDLATTPLLPNTAYTPLAELKAESSLDKSMIGSPMKKQRASLSTEEDSVRQARADALAKGLGFGFGGENGIKRNTDKSGNNGIVQFGGNISNSNAGKGASETTLASAAAGEQPKVKEEDMDEEL